MDDHGMTTREAAEALGYTVQHVRRLARNGELKAEKQGRDWFISESSVEAFAVRDQLIKLPLTGHESSNGSGPARTDNGRPEATPTSYSVVPREVNASVREIKVLSAADDLLATAGNTRFHTILADPPWRFNNRTGKVAPEHRRLSRYETMSLDQIKGLPVADIVEEPAHLYLWVPNALLPRGLEVMDAWGFDYKTNLIWHKIRKDGGPDGRGVGFYFRNTTEVILFGIRGKNARTLKPGRSQVNIIKTRKREHSRKPDELYPIIEGCSRGPFMELFARGSRKGWHTWGNEAEDYSVDWPTYSNHSQANAQRALKLNDEE